jgi:hypothetical protein
MSHEKNPTARTVPPNARDEDAVFSGWQRTGSGKVIPLYTITATGHPSRGSTVSDKTLHNLNLQVPGAPPAQGPADFEKGDDTNPR